MNIQYIITIERKVGNKNSENMFAKKREMVVLSSLYSNLLYISITDVPILDQYLYVWSDVLISDTKVEYINYGS